MYKNSNWIIKPLLTHIVETLTNQALKMKIEDAIQQKSFKSEYHKANINILFTQAWIQSQITQELRAFNISPQQFNIMRILRGHYPKPASIKELTDRMIDKASNASRLVDKLLTKGYVNKTPCKMDNRRMEVVITEDGLEMLRKASDKIEACINEMFSAINDEEAKTLNYLLDKIRS